MNSKSNYEIEGKRYNVERLFVGQKRVQKIIEQLSRQEITKQNVYMPTAKDKTCDIIYVE